MLNPAAVRPAQAEPAASSVAGARGAGGGPASLAADCQDGAHPPSKASWGAITSSGDLSADAVRPAAVAGGGASSVAPSPAKTRPQALGKVKWKSVKRVMANRKMASDLNAQLEERRAQEQAQLAKAMRFRFHPDGRFRVVWNTVLLAALFLTLIQVPLCIGMYVGEHASPPALLYAVQGAVDVILLLDVLVNFNTAVWLDTTDKVLLPSLHHIAVTYARSWLLADLVALVPFSLISTSTWAATDQLGWVLRLARLLRLPRFARMGSLRTLVTDSDLKTLNDGVVRMANLFAYVSLLAHVLACGWFLVGSTTTFEDQTWLRAYEDGLLLTADTTTQYVAALYWTVTTMTGVGYGDITGTNTSERLYAIFTMLVGASMFGFIIGNISSLLEGIDRRGALYKRKLSDVKETLNACQVPKSLQRKVRKYYEYYLSHKSLFNESSILNDLSQTLRVQVIMEANRDLVARQDDFLRVCADENFVASIFMLLKPIYQHEGDVFCRQGEVGKEMYFMFKGAVELLYDSKVRPAVGIASEQLKTPESQDSRWKAKKAGKQAVQPRGGDKKRTTKVLGVLASGGYFGELSLLLHMSRALSIRALMPCEAYLLAKEDLWLLLERHPEVLEALVKEAERRLQLLQDVMFSYGESCVLGSQRKRRSAVQGGGGRPTNGSFADPSTMDVIRDLHDTAERKRLAEEEKEREEEEERKLNERELEQTEGLDGGTGGSITRKLSATTMAAIKDAQELEVQDLEESSQRRSSRSLSRAGSKGLLGDLSEMLGMSGKIAQPHPQKSTKGVHDVEEGEAYALYNFLPTTLPGIRLLVGSSMSDAMRSFFVTRRSSIVAEQAAQVAMASGQLEEVAEEDEFDLLARWIVHPQSAYKLRWDMFIALLICYSVVSIPFRIGFEIDPQGGALAFDIFIDCCFFLDMGVNFRTAYFDDLDVLVTIPRKIAIHYLRGWLFVDTISTMPIDWVASLISGGSTQRLRSLKLLRAARLARLLKLLRLIKLSRFMRVVEDAVDITPALTRLLKLMFQVSLVAHWSACFWYFNTADPNGSSDTWWINMGLENGSTFDLYVASFYWAIMSMTTVGYGDVLPYSNSERLYVIGAMIIGATVFGYIVGSMASLVAQLRGVAARNKERFAEIKAYMDERRLTPSTRRTLMAYFETYYAHKFAFHARSRVILAELSDSLRKQLVLHMYKEELAKTLFFEMNEDPGAVSTILQLMRVEFCRPTELVFKEGDFGRTVYFLVKGSVQIVGNCGKPGETVYKVLHEGNCFGEIAMLMSVKRTASVRALTFCMMLVLDKPDFDEITRQYPELGEKFSGIFQNTIRGMAQSSERMKLRPEHQQEQEA